MSFLLKAIAHLIYMVPALGTVSYRQEARLYIGNPELNPEINAREGKYTTKNTKQLKYFT